MLIQQAKEVLQIEAQSILDLMEQIGPTFSEAVSIILKAKGRVILTGMGKSGLVARKISATLNSTGTKSFFLHPAEAIHGDLGMATPDDVILAISNSGHTVEINKILPILKQMEIKIISMTGGLNSPMAHHSDLVIDVGVEREACPLGMAPTASTTATLAMGDALAVVLLKSRHFSKKDFRRFHPGGSLGERLSLKIRDVMATDDHVPKVYVGTGIRTAILEINAKKMGATLIVDRDQKLVGIVSDGDLRRALTQGDDIYRKNVEDIMSATPKTIDEEATSAEAISLMELNAITHLIIVDAQQRVKGMVHLHDLLGREGFKVNGE
ncbi:MAG: arabinose-5-phosphate isomerase [Desulfobacteraceae bacterium 4572_87]|nr:MAG: arabinose-5-phosphate isomerase [Desulfobacteraceae bacterium 4572_87]